MARGDWRGDEWPNPFVQWADVSRVLSIAIHWIRLEPWRGPFPACDSSSEERIGFLDSISISSIRFPSYFFSPDFVLFFSTRLWFLLNNQGFSCAEDFRVHFLQEANFQAW